MTSPRTEPCVCHTHTEKQALHNRSVKSPCSKTGAEEGGSWAASGKKSWCTQMTSGRANDPRIHQEISVPPQLRSRDKAPSCTDGGLTHTTQGEYQLQEETRMMGDHSGMFRGAVFKVDAGLR